LNRLLADSPVRGTFTTMHGYARCHLWIRLCAGD
jgi:hypothetical protein